MEPLELKLKDIFLEYLFAWLREFVGKGRSEALGIVCFILFLTPLYIACIFLCTRMMSSHFRNFLVYFPIQKKDHA